MNKCNIILSLGLFFGLSQSLQASQIELRSKVASHRTAAIDNASLFVPGQLGKVAVMHNKSGFSIQEGSRIRPLHNESLSKPLQGISKEHLAKVLASGYLSVKKDSDGQYSIKHNVRGNGGGPIGVTVGATVGFAAVNGVAYGTIGYVSTFFGPAAPWVASTVGAALAPAITVASHAAAIGCGIALGVVTGPF